MPKFRTTPKAKADEAATTPLLTARQPGGAQPMSSDAAMTDFEVASSWADEEDQLSREKLQMIKARTMYEMVEEVELPGGPCKLLFLTNVQANLLGHSEDSLQKMLDALEVPKPQLIINLLSSQGFQGCVDGGAIDASAAGAGLVSNRTPFLTPEEERAAEQRIDRFMADVLIPLAAQTNAVVITTPFLDSILTVSLMRMYSVQRSKWGGKPPFTIISAGASTDKLYQNAAMNACWRDVRRQSRAWRARDKKIIDLAHQLHARPDGSLPDALDDFDANCSCIITVDMIESKKENRWDKGPFTNLLTNLVRYLGSSLPSLALKTGHADALTLVEAGNAMSSIDIALNAAQAGTPVLFLDVRERPLFEATDRVELIEGAKAALGAHCDKLLEAGLAESLVCSSIAYLQEALFGAPAGAGGDRLQGAAHSRSALHEAIRYASSEDAGLADTVAQGLKRATPKQAGQLATWFADRFFQDAFAVLVDRAEREARGETYQMLYKERILALQVWTEAIVTSPNFHAINLSDCDRAARVVGQLVRLDRLPKQNPLEGLTLLQEAWKSHDIAVHLANYYKGVSKFLFVLQLLIVWTVTVSTALGSSAFIGRGLAVDCSRASGLREQNACLLRELKRLRGLPGSGPVPYSEAAFVLAAVASVLISIDGLLNAKGRWRQLRSSAGSLESMIWCYRTRVGDFELTGADINSHGPETRMRHALVAWRRNLMTGGDLQLSGFSRSYPPSTYTHHQFPESGPLGPEDVDDHYSPVQPHRYIELRILPSIAFYERRTPWYSSQRFLVKAMLLLCTLAATLLSRYQLMIWVVGVTSGAAALTSWQEYADVGRKTMRYTHAAIELQNVLSWWKSLSEVERASKATIAQLIHTAEGVISEERLAWMSTANKHHEAAAAEQGAKNEQGAKKDRADKPLSP